MFRSGASAPLLLTLSLGLSGCFVMRKEHDEVAARATAAEQQSAHARSEVAALRADLDATRQRLDNALRASADSSTDLLTSKQRINELAGKVDEALHSVDELKRDLAASRTEIYERFDELKRVQQPTPTPAAPPVQVPADKSAHYRLLEESHAKRDWAATRSLAAEYVNRYPADDHADQALYFAGDADLSEGRPSSALGNFNRLLKLYPRSKMLDRTLFNMGEAYMMMHDCADAKLAYEACDRRFSKEKIGADARARLAVITRNAPGTCAPP